ncbi:MAG: patatin-like phospholipase family protein [Endomicrobium sp.]|nr:patatin-like phospholipase family protein [Endomicrobium sp.]
MPFIRKIFLILVLSFFVSIAIAYVYDFDEDVFLIDSLWRKVKTLPKEKRPKVVLVLGGGGARGISHIGVFRVLYEEQIPIDLVVGTSVGSIAGAFYCAGLPIENFENIAKNIHWKDISNFSYPSLISMFLNENLLSNEKLGKFVSKNIGEINFAQLKVPLICVATDLNTGERILLREGSVGFAVRASAAIPGIFKPVEYRQRYLVDGGLVENIPVNVAKIFNADIIIVVSVAADITKNNIDNVFATLMQAIYIQGKTLDQENLDMSDIVIYPDVGEISAFDFRNAYKTIDKGFIAAKRSLKNIKMTIINKITENVLLE